MRLSELLQGEYETEDKYGDLEILSLQTDSRKTMPNGLFFCLKGEQADGHIYAADAVKNGAVAVVTERRLPILAPQILVPSTREALAKWSSVFYGEPSKKMKVVGITGTNGKTTTSYFLASILEQAGKKTGVIGTLGTYFNGQTVQGELTTPDPIELQERLHELQSQGAEYVVMEVSAHALYYEKTSGVRFAACIFTNLTQDHLDFFKTMSAYKAAKCKLFHSSVCPLAILNGDDETGREIGSRLEKENATEKWIYYGMQTPADAFALVTEQSEDGTECMLNIEDKLCRVTLALPGLHNVYNALAAATCASLLGIPLTAIAKGLQGVNKVRGRLEKVVKLQGASIYVDFAHTPDGLEKSLQTLRRYCKGRLVCLFGCGGNRDVSKRPIMGECAAKSADFAILTSDNPRYEDPLDILSAVEKGYRNHSVKYVVIPDRRTAIEYALDFIQKGDILLIAGKGAEGYQEIMGIKYPFNDQDIVEKILEKKGKPLFS